MCCYVFAGVRAVKFKAKYSIKQRPNNCPKQLHLLSGNECNNMNIGVNVVFFLNSNKTLVVKTQVTKKRNSGCSVCRLDGRVIIPGLPVFPTVTLR